MIYLNFNLSAHKPAISVVYNFDKMSFKSGKFITSFRNMLLSSRMLTGLAVLAVVTVLLISNRTSSIAGKAQPELAILNQGNLSFTQIRDLIKKTAESKGADYAFQVLRKSSLPADTDYHLLGHVIGDVLYRRNGAEGIKLCTEDFRNACSHAVVAGMTTDLGENGLSKIISACQQAPGGMGAINICFHGLGHGILSTTSYDLSKTVGSCLKIASDEDLAGPNAQCISGAIMEIISGGDHDKKLWAERRQKYLSTSHPLSLCQLELIPDSAKYLCFIYLTPHLLNVSGSTSNSPNEDTLKAAFNYCQELTGPYSYFLEACYGGFGKEFVPMSVRGDIRDIKLMTNEQMSQVHHWCHLAPNAPGELACLNNALYSLFWGGENNRSTSIAFCNLASPSLQNSCFNSLIRSVRQYVTDTNYRHDFCREIPSIFTGPCQQELNVT